MEDLTINDGLYHTKVSDLTMVCNGLGPLTNLITLCVGEELSNSWVHIFSCDILIAGLTTSARFWQFNFLRTVQFM